MIDSHIDYLQIENNCHFSKNSLEWFVNENALRFTMTCGKHWTNHIRLSGRVQLARAWNYYTIHRHYTLEMFKSHIWPLCVVKQFFDSFFRSRLMRTFLRGLLIKFTIKRRRIEYWYSDWIVNLNLNLNLSNRFFVRLRKKTLHPFLICEFQLYRPTWVRCFSLHIRLTDITCEIRSLPNFNCPISCDDDDDDIQQMKFITNIFNSMRKINLLCYYQTTWKLNLCTTIIFFFFSTNNSIIKCIMIISTERIMHVERGGKFPLHKIYRIAAYRNQLDLLHHTHTHGKRNENNKLISLYSVMLVVTIGYIFLRTSYKQLIKKSVQITTTNRVFDGGAFFLFHFCKLRLVWHAQFNFSCCYCWCGVFSSSSHSSSL